MKTVVFLALPALPDSFAAPAFFAGLESRSALRTWPRAVFGPWQNHHRLARLLGVGFLSSGVLCENELGLQLTSKVFVELF